MKNILEALKNFLISKRMKSLYWKTGCTFGVAVIAVITDQMPSWGLNTSIVVVLGLALSEITKALNNLAQGKEA